MTLRSVVSGGLLAFSSQSIQDVTNHFKFQNPKSKIQIPKFSNPVPFDE
ncbi:hypothetical protein NC99_40110 [Sunxiuqinia dokdonensis]|uniref:Uncharacterized protein n=1 Tax=Sunxiuqinia dokdonensis TaxID=1409788 RepID=A0A0L8V4T1_9BACT|nr:hypothetical protein NC99_40110 [Sunxiuqinia dokdonensis]